jgi:hypothetical protein
MCDLIRLSIVLNITSGRTILSNHVTQTVRGKTPVSVHCQRYVLPHKRVTLMLRLWHAPMHTDRLSDMNERTGPVSALRQSIVSCI